MHNPDVTAPTGRGCSIPWEIPPAAVRAVDRGSRVYSPKGVKRGITLRVVGEENILLFRMIIILHFGTK